jgi:two-component system CitB family sensor kinase
VARGTGRSSLARRLLLLQLAVVALTVTIGAAVTVSSVHEHATQEQRERALAVAETVAQDPEVAAALDDGRPSRTLQPLAERVRRATGVTFVVVMSPQGVRYSHPNPARIGQRFVGRIDEARRGGRVIETTTGTLGRSVRAVLPVRSDGRVIGLVSAGVLTEEVTEQLLDELPRLLGLAAVALAVGAALSLLVARRVKRQTLGLEPDEITRLYEEDQAVLHAIREGVLVLDRDRRLLLANDEARRLLRLPTALEGRPAADLVPAGALRELVASGREASDELQLVGERVLVVNQREARVDGRPVGTVATLRDRTELDSLVRELATVRGMADALRAQAHEAANRLHTLVGLVELGRYDEAISFATREASAAQGMLHALQERVREPALVALLLGKLAVAEERGIALRLSDDTDFASSGLPAIDLVTIVGNLVDNALDAVAELPDAAVQVTLHSLDREALIEVRDSGPGIREADIERVFEAGWSTKPAGAHGRGVGLALVRQTAARLGGSVAAASDGGAVFTVRLPLTVRERPLTEVP